MRSARFPRCLLFLAALTASAAPPDDDKTARIPEPLKAWADWATWDNPHRHCPTPYSDPKKHLCFWPSKLALDVQKAGGRFELAVTVFSETWMPLPGSAESWPLTVTANGAPVPVVEHGGVPSVRLTPGTHQLAGTYRWADLPQQIALPREIGVLSLSIDGAPVEAPVWDAQGSLWLRRDGSAEEADKPFLLAKVYALLEDGIPLWLRTEIELTVSGKSREEDLGTVLPEGWKLAAVESPIPVSIDDAGRMKAQVRAGKWTVRAEAFRFDNPKEFRFPQGAQVAVQEELVAFRARPDFRMVEIVGAPSIDVSQTTFPEKWRELPVYRWDTAQPFRFEERMRGMGEQKPAGLTIARQWWLDDDGRGLTFRDRINGQMQQIWRLDAAPGQDLGSVRSGGQGQLITRNPTTGSAGVEIRTRSLDLEATGRMHRAPGLAATGWSSDADALNVTLNLPPGWRLFALFGADWVRGDWLTAWTLLDLFLLLIFTLAVFRLWGIGAAALAFVAFGLAYHEPFAPRYTWLLLLIPLALARVVPEGRGQRLLAAVKWIGVASLLLVLVPFVVKQVQQALYPQLEAVGARTDIWASLPPAAAAPDFASQEAMQEQNISGSPADAADAPARPNEEYAFFRSSAGARNAGLYDNLQYDTKARIQTGPGVPEWSWRTVSFGWNGPVQAAQGVRPILISRGVERVLTVARVVLLLALAGVLLGAKRWSAPLFRVRGKAAALLVAALCGSATPLHAQAPDQATLDKLRERLLTPSDAYPTAADIASVSLKLAERRITIDAEVHAAIRTAVPLPGRLPAWSPVAVSIDDKPEAALRRDDGYLWVVLEPGVHKVRVEGLLTNLTEWEWTFLLKPRQVAIDAPGWTVTGVRPDGVPEQQVFFVLKQKAVAGEASYDRQDVQTIAVVDRRLELGLVWQVRTTITRLSPPGKAVALRVPLLPGENVLSSNAIVRDGAIDVRLGAQEKTFTWESGLAITEAIQLATRPEDAWVERWHLLASPVWNVALTGLPPTFEPANADLVPVWQPWPGESVALAISRPEAIAGATVTVSRGTHRITLGKRQRVSKLELSLRCSLGQDFLIDLPASAEITSLAHSGKMLPVRKDGARLVIPLRPGEQSITVDWKMNTLLGFRAVAEDVRLPVEAANITTIIAVPSDRWVLWANGPLRGPAVRFWGILICSLLAALALGRVTGTPLRSVEWMLLVIGLTQVPLVAALVVVGWLFLLVWRGSESFQALPQSRSNFLQLMLAGITAISLGILLVAVGEGLLGYPEMFIRGQGSTSAVLQWYQARSETLLPRPETFSVSIWWFRFLMLAWALWLAAALIRWLRWGWEQFSRGGVFRKTPPVLRTPPAVVGTPPPLVSAWPPAPET